MKTNVDLNNLKPVASKSLTNTMGIAVFYANDEEVHWSFFNGDKYGSLYKSRLYYSVKRGAYFRSSTGRRCYLDEFIRI